ncbi:MAG TPA: hypothetical protein VHG89_08930 [Verrucomicrobiae bacterium]|nr:hypothetical protein [Verrucomicrobiae bacterium]
MSEEQSGEQKSVQPQGSAQPVQSAETSQTRVSVKPDRTIEAPKSQMALGSDPRVDAEGLLRAVRPDRTVHAPKSENLTEGFDPSKL